MEYNIKDIIKMPVKSNKDPYLDMLIGVLNDSRVDTKYKPITYARLNTMLKKFGKSKKNWDRNIFIGNILDAPNPSKYFWWKWNKLKFNINK